MFTGNPLEPKQMLTEAEDASCRGCRARAGKDRSETPALAATVVTVKTC